MAHEIIDTFWTPQVNMHVVRCPTGKTFNIRADRWRVHCPHCNKTGSITVLRDRWAAEHGNGDF
jgi:hypothetical protein